jgi:eukaryotic-like serine/threonine-protein kinase
VPPGARVFVGDRELDQRTPVQVSDLAPGTYQIRVDNGSNYAPWLTQINIAAGQVVALPSAVLTLRTVTVEFLSEPSGAEVTLVRGSEQRRLGRTPVSADVDITGAAWRVTMRRDGHREYDSELALSSSEPRASHTATLEQREVVARGGGGGGGGTAPRIATPRPAGGGGGEARPAAAAGGTGTLRINTRPWSQVFVDGRLIGNTPQMNITLPAGRHTVTLVNPEFNIRQTVQVEITAGQTETRVLTLQPGG